MMILEVHIACLKLNENYQTFSTWAICKTKRLHFEYVNKSIPFWWWPMVGYDSKKYVRNIMGLVSLVWMGE